MDENNLCDLIKTDCSDAALLRLEELHSPLCFNVMNKYTPVFSTLGINLNDIYEEKQKLILEAATTFNSTKKCKFSTWLGNRVRYRCLKEINKKKKSPQIVTLLDKDLSNMLEQMGFSPQNDDLTKYVDTILGGLADKRIKKVFKYRYYEELTFAQIGRKMKLTAQGVSNLHKTGIKLLRAKLKNERNIDET